MRDSRAREITHAHERPAHAKSSRSKPRAPGLATLRRAHTSRLTRFFPMHSSSATASSSRRLLPQAAVCSAGILLGVLSYHLLKRSDSASNVPPRAANTIIERLPSRPLHPTTPFTSGEGLSITETAVVARLEEIFAPGRLGRRYFAKLAAWAEAASEEELKLALKFGWKITDEDESHTSLIDSVVLSRLAEIDGEMALSAMLSAQQERPGTISTEAKEAMFESWSSWDPPGAVKGALALLNAEPDSDFGPSVPTLLREVGQQFPHLVRDVASALARSREASLRQIGFDSHAGLMHDQLANGAEVGSVVAWIGATQVSSEERRYLMVNLLEQSLESQPVAVSLSIFRQLESPPGPELTRSLIQDLGASEPAIATQLLLTLPEGEERREATDQFVKQLISESGRQSAYDWLAAQQSHADLDEAYERLADSFAATDRRSAWTCVNCLVGDPAHKSALLHEFAFKWLKADFATASREVPSEYVDRYQRSTALLQELTRTFPGAAEDFAFTWSRSHRE